MHKIANPVTGKVQPSLVRKDWTMIRRILPPLAVTAMFGSAAYASDVMNADQLGALISGNTLYVDVPAGAPGAPEGGTAPIFYGTDGAATALLPAGLKLVGTWALDGDSYCIDWDNGPKNSCSQLMRTANGFVITDVAKGEPRGLVTRLAIGNPENL